LTRHQYSCAQVAKHIYIWKSKYQKLHTYILYCYTLGEWKDYSDKDIFGSFDKHSGTKMPKVLRQPINLAQRPELT
jgi:hypothetical protein